MISQVRSLSAGMTLVELIVVMLIMGILSASIITNFSSRSQFAADTQAEQMRRDLSHIQLLATSWGVALRLTISSDGTNYTVSCRSVATGTPCTTVGATPLDPATGDSFSVTFTDSVTIASPLNDAIDFDSLGRPISGTTLQVTNPVRDYVVTGNGRTVHVYLRPLGGFAETG